MTARKQILRGVVVVAALVSVGCSRGPLKVATVQLGRALNSDKSIATHATRFTPDQTVHVAVLTDGPGSGEIAARWTLAGRTLSEEKRDVSYTQGAATEFHLNYAGGLPPGTYSVEIFIDGTSVEHRDFRVEP